MAYSERHNRYTEFWLRLVEWRERHFKENRFLIFLSLVIGVVCGFAAQLLKYLIHLISTLLTSHFHQTEANYLYLLYPAAGILFSLLFVKFIVKGNISHGVTRVLFAISQRKSRLKKKFMWSSLIASSVTIGFGGSVGAEGPIVYTGAAIGSNIGQAFRLSPKILMILVGCGAAAGIAGIFRAPIAGMLFTLEVLMIDLTAVTVMPLLISSISASVVAYVLEGYGAEFFFSMSEPFVTRQIPYVIILGLICGLVSYYFTQMMFLSENIFSNISSAARKYLFGTLVVITLIFLFPPLYGEGYDAINNLLKGDASHIVDGTFFYIDRHSVWFIAGYIGLIVLTKVFATAATNGAGGVGGTFAPSLFVGAMVGFLFAYVFNNLEFGVQLSGQNFALIGMAGVMAGVMHAPLMAIFLTAEMTGGYDLFLPLLIVSTLSYMTIKAFVPYSIYSLRLAKNGELMTHAKDKTVLNMLNIRSLVETDFKAVSPNMTLGEVVETISNSRRNLFPVINENGEFIGVVLLDDLRNIMFRTDLYDKMTVRRFMAMPPARIQVTDSMEKVMKTFDKTNAWNLPVLDNDRYVGFVSKSKIFNSYRDVLRNFSDD